MGKFVVSEAGTGYKFVLKANNGQVIVSSGIYASENSCLGGVESVRRNSLTGKLDDSTDESRPRLTNPKFQIYLDPAGAYRFRLIARNGEIIALSAGYASKSACVKGVANIQKNALEAQVVRI